jgi:hypothetical protein
MFNSRVRHYWVAFSLSLLAVAYCVLVYGAGERHGLSLGARYLAAIPNYYLFYLVVLPFVATGVLHLGLENRNIRFVGDISGELDDETRRKVERFRRILPAVCLLFSALIIVQDAAEKNHALPPYAFRFQEPEQAGRVERYYACAKGWIACELSEQERTVEAYLIVLKRNGYVGSSATGFRSFDAWWSGSSWLYRFESFLSFLAALVVSALFAEVFLLVMTKNYVRPATRNLMIWMAVLVTLWFPAKMYAAWSVRLGPFSPPGIAVFGLALLVLGVLLVLFVKTERDQLGKYASAVTAVFSLGLASVSYLKPELIHRGVLMMEKLGLVYTGIVAALLFFALYLVTDYFIRGYDEEVRPPDA